MKKQKLTFMVALLVLTGSIIFFRYTNAEEKKYGGTVVIGMKADFDSFNELNASDADALQVIENMLFLRLTRLNEQLNFEPSLAKSWTFSDDGRILTYYLRQDVRWSDGQPTTAADVLFTYQMAIHPEVVYPAASRFDLVERVEIIDDYTIKFIFKKVYPDALFDTQMPILPQHILGQYPPDKIKQSDFNRQPVGNGPFILSEWKANQLAVFVANPDFALGRPYLDRVIFAIIPDETVLLTNLLTHQIHVIPALSARDFLKLQTDPSLRVIRFDGRGYSFLAWNCARPLFTKNSRRALTQAINKKEIIKTLMEDFAKPAVGPLLPFVWAFDSTLQDLNFDPNLARQLLENEGWADSDGDGVLDRDGKNFELIMKTNAGSQIRKDVLVMLQAQFQKIGISAQIEIVEYNLLLEQIFEKKDFDAFLSGWDADFTVNPTDLFHSKAIADGYNFVSYQNPEVDWLLEKGRELADQKLARPYWIKFQKIILEDCPYSFLFINDRLAGYDKKIRGLKMDVRGFLTNINEWWLDQ